MKVKKLFQLLITNFQIINFLGASLIVSLIAVWYNSPTTTNGNLSSPPSTEEETSTPNQTKTSDNSAPVDEPEKSPQKSPSQEKDNLSEEKSLTPPTEKESIPKSPKTKITSKLGHFAFAEAPRNRLQKSDQYYEREEYLDKEAHQAFKTMQASALKEGIELVLISGFRDVSSQEKLFQRQVKRQGSAEKASKWSAPAGYSEHHTGYAVDIGDGKQPQQDLKIEFESTLAYQWLIKNAEGFGFELSFPRDNVQGVSFEPWHWRYIGSPRAQEIFAVPLQASQDKP